MLIGCAFCWLLAFGRLLHWNFCWFWLFLRDFHFMDYHESPKRSPQKVRDHFWRLWTGRSWTTPINSPHTSWKPPPLAKYLRVTRICNGGVNWRNRSGCWSQWPSQCWRLWSRCLLVWIWISWKFVHRRMPISNGWILSLKIRSRLSVRVSLNSHFYPAFRLLKRRKIS